MSMASEFKEFALKGNVMDLAVGVIIGVLLVRLLIQWLAILLCQLLEKSLVMSIFLICMLRLAVRQRVYL